MTDTSPPPVASAPRKWRDRALLIGLLALVIAGLIGAAAATGWEETKTQLLKLAPWQFAALLGLSLFNYGFRSLRWHVFARKLGLPLTFGTNSLHFLGGFAMSVTPGRLGELVRMRWIRRETGWAFERTAPLVLMDRAADLSAMAIILALALAFSTTGIAGGIPVTAIALLVAFVVTRPAILSHLATLGHRATGHFTGRLTGRFARLFARVRRAARSLDVFSAPGLMGVATVIGLIGWFAEGYAFHLLLVWMGADIGLAKAIAIFVFATLAGGLTGAPGGVGGAEAAMIALLSLEGIGLETSIPATAIIRVTTLWFAILIGLVLFPIAERQSKKHALENH
ncbi:YbhN family protein [uncultured Maritimibacter sp.]|uniref:lysylphosphatidylglycerol synthase transmembrane domain-containing protein n=1 Tax=uncultured Maritimibacter sp. TaxID=991866 RepID=UPI000B270B36